MLFFVGARTCIRGKCVGESETPQQQLDNEGQTGDEPEGRGGGVTV
jgi:hypothetical protein